jgi:hypothetical protein
VPSTYFHEALFRPTKQQVADLLALMSLLRCPARGLARHVPTNRHLEAQLKYRYRLVAEGI